MSFKLLGFLMSSILIMLSSLGTPSHNSPIVENRDALASKVQVAQQESLSKEILLIDEAWMQQHSDLSISLFNLKGQKLGMMPLLSNQVKLDKEKLKSGFYFIQISQAETILLTKRFKVD